MYTLINKTNTEIYMLKWYPFPQLLLIESGYNGFLMTVIYTSLLDIS